MSIPDIKGACPKCGNKTFDSTTGPKPKDSDYITCSRCGHKLRVGDVVREMGRKATDAVANDLRNLIDKLNKRR